MNGTDLLHEAGGLVALGWCQHAEARTLHGAATDVMAGNAAEWSLLGALQAVTFRDATTTMADLRDALSAIADRIDDPSLAHWNDAPSRTQVEVRSLLEDAERRAGA